MNASKGLNRNYWLFWFASSLGMGASNILQYVLSLYLLDLTGSATLFASMLSIIVIPRLLLTPIAGVLADRFRKNRMMALILLGEAGGASEFVREYTLASGGPYCDCGYKKKG